MAKIIKKVTGLKPQQNYLFTLKAKNSEVSAVDPTYDSLRILTPGKADTSGAPESIDDATFDIIGNYKSVMFSFEPTSEIDIKEYDYELYSDSSGTNLISSGKATASVFTIDVPDNTRRFHR